MNFAISSMSETQPTQQKPKSPEAERYAKAVRNAALLAVIACPILALTPPRKLDIYTVGLVGVTGYSANYLVLESSGRSIWQHVSRQQPRRFEQQPSVVAEIQKQGRVDSSRERWKLQKQKEIKEEVEEGKGFGDMIVDQIWEVWNQGKPKDEEDDG